ncbi:MAG: hypothetical protein IPG99_07395 [Ignavibacteria bacterium]|nr:hypothetical protein [Ignavibacteria bacterium]
MSEYANIVIDNDRLRYSVLNLNYRIKKSVWFQANPFRKDWEQPGESTTKKANAEKF